MSEPIRVVIVEDNDVFREALELLLGLRPQITVVASVSYGTDAAAVAAEVQPDVVLMDYRLPGIDGVQATRAVLEDCPGTAVVCLTAALRFRFRDPGIRPDANLERPRPSGGYVRKERVNPLSPRFLEARPGATIGPPSTPRRASQPVEGSC